VGLAGLGILTLAGGTFRAIFTPPFSWRGEFVDQAWQLAKRASIPAAISAFGFGYGAPECRVADRRAARRSHARRGHRRPGDRARAGRLDHRHGRRRRRRHRDLRRPRRAQGARRAVGAAGDGRRPDPLARRAARARADAADAALGIVVITTEAFAIMLANLQVTGTVGGYFEATSHSFTTIDLVANLVKTSVSGFVVGLVCCYKGMNAKGGPVGVAAPSPGGRDLVLPDLDLELRVQLDLPRGLPGAQAVR